MKTWKELSKDERTPEEGYREALRRISAARESGEGWLNLVGLKLQRIPPEVKRVAGLTELKLYDNQIADLAPLAELTELTSLSLFSNQIVDLAPLAELKELTSLNLFKNQIVNLAPLSELTRLSLLTLNSNQIIDLAPLAKLTELTNLSLGWNQIADLAPLAELTKLNKLRLEGNPISSLRPIRNLLRQEPDLHFGINIADGIHLAHCPLTDPPIEIAKQGAKAILRYWKTEGRLGTRTNRTGRILLLGDGAAGKSSLSDKLADDNAIIVAGQRKQTQGIEIKEVPFTVGAHEYTGRIWDLGGQEHQHVLHQYFFGRRSLYVVVVNERKDTQHYDRWLRMIDLLGKRAGEKKTPVLVLFNVRGDLCGADVRKVFLTDYGQTYQELSLIGCGINLGRAPEKPNDPAWLPLRERIGEALSELPLMGEMLASNFALLEWVEQREERYVSFADFKAYATSEAVGLISEAEVIDALNFLHALGEVVYYDELPPKSILRDYVFLDPQWIVDALYQILRLEYINRQQGRFTRRLLHGTWRREGYSDKDVKLLEMLLLENAFELCYRLDDDPDYDFLYPGALAEDPGVLEWTRPDADHIRFRLKYPGYVPAGLMTRFLVRRHRHVAGTRLYRHGVVLEHLAATGKNEKWLYAKIEAPKLPSGAKNVVDVTIATKGRPAVEWLTELRRELQDIHDTFYGRVRPREVIRCTCETCRQATEMEVYEWPLQELIGDYEDGDRTAKCKKSRTPFQIADLLYGVYAKEDPVFRQIEQVRSKLDRVGADVVAVKAITRDSNRRIRQIEAALSAIKTNVDTIKEQLFVSTTEQRAYFTRIDQIIAALPAEKQPDPAWQHGPLKDKVKVGIDLVKIITRLTTVELEGLNLKLERELALPKWEEVKKTQTWTDFKRWFLVEG